jgi:uncharacterized protein YcbX
MDITIASLHCYPIKSCGRTALQEARLSRQGIANDRRWMLAQTETGVFLSQREHARMALLQPAVTEETLTVTAPGMPPLSLPLLPDTALDTRTATVWKATHETLDEGAEAAAWFSDYLGVSCRLVRAPEDYARRLNPNYGREEDRIGFADGYPLLLASEASLADLNSRLNKALPMDRFRPNLVVQGEGLAPFAEDDWKTLTIPAANVTFRVAKPCARCAITTINQVTGAPEGPEPLKAMAKFRRDANGKVLFGMNLIHDWREGSPLLLRVGNTVVPGTK